MNTKIATFSFESKPVNMFVTDDYSKFKFIKGNRKSAELQEGLTKHATNVKNSISKAYLFTLIIVNESMQIIDGQNRFAALRDLKLPVYYVVVQGYNGEELRRLNETAKTWGKADYMNFFVAGNNKDYIILKQFVEAYPNFAISTFITLLGGAEMRTSNNYKVGTFKVKMKDLKLFEAELTLIIDLAQTFIEESKQINRDFAEAALSVIRHSRYNHKQMLSSMERPASIDLFKSCKAVSSYYRVTFSKAYNYNRMAKHQINFHTNKDLENTAGL